uniref:GPS domain-containing protein n=1 Tax=Caenorhabditis tropicalis TaxID=1561998 RepID=A0A1I7TYZ4_9PELO
MSATLLSGNTVIESFNYAERSTHHANYHKKMVKNFPPIAKLQFSMGNIPKPLHGNIIVSWFNTATNEWSLEEQCTVDTDSNEIVTASCGHLTDFTVLIHGQLDAEYVCSWPLVVIGYSVNGTSILCLLVLIIIGSMF